MPAARSAAAPGLEVPLRPRMLRVVVENLIANAIRYSGPGSNCSITVSQDGDQGLDGRCRRRRMRASESPKTDLPRICSARRFYRADRARSSRGTGLGLAIVKHVVTSAGGTVEAHSAPGKGLEIVCTFPAAS